MVKSGILDFQAMVNGNHPGFPVTRKEVLLFLGFYLVCTLIYYTATWITWGGLETGNSSFFNPEEFFAAAGTDFIIARKPLNSLTFRTESPSHSNHVVIILQFLTQKLHPAHLLFSRHRVCNFIVCKRMATGACVNQMVGIIFFALRFIHRTFYAGLCRLVQPATLSEHPFLYSLPTTFPVWPRSVFLCTLAPGSIVSLFPKALAPFPAIGIVRSLCIGGFCNGPSDNEASIFLCRWERQGFFQLVPDRRVLLPGLLPVPVTASLQYV